MMRWRTGRWGIWAGRGLAMALLTALILLAATWILMPVLHVRGGPP